MKESAKDGGRLTTTMHDAKVTRHQTLLQEYLVMHKEVDMKKKRYQSLERKRATLMVEVRFLRRRYQQLLLIRAGNKKLDDCHRPQSSNNQVQQSNQVEASEPLLRKTYLTTDLHPILAGVLKEGRIVQACPNASLTPNKKVKTCSINEKGMMKKKKISWQDQEPVKV